MAEDRGEDVDPRSRAPSGRRMIRQQRQRGMGPPPRARPIRGGQGGDLGRVLRNILILLGALVAGLQGGRIMDRPEKSIATSGQITSQEGVEIRKTVDQLSQDMRALGVELGSIRRDMTDHNPAATREAVRGLERDVERIHDQLKELRAILMRQEETSMFFENLRRAERYVVEKMPPPDGFDSNATNWDQFFIARMRQLRDAAGFTRDGLALWTELYFPDESCERVYVSPEWTPSAYCPTEGPQGDALPAVQPGNCDAPVSTCELVGTNGSLCRWQCIGFVALTFCSGPGGGAG